MADCELLRLIETKRTDKNLLERMSGHYSKPKGFVGRNICYAIYYNNIYCGHIVFGSCTLHLPGRKELISGLSKNNGVNNLFFNVSIPDGYVKYPIRNFTTKVLMIGEELVKKRWKEKYGDDVLWFESLVQPPRKGYLYLKAKYKLIGITKGFTCKRGPNESEKSDGWGGKRVWDKSTDNLQPKLVFFKKVSDRKEVNEEKSESSSGKTNSTTKVSI